MGADFDGTNWALFDGWPIPDTATGKITVCCWIKTSNLSGSLQRIWGSGGNMEARTDVAGKLYNDMWEQSGGSPASAATLVNGQVYHVAFTGDGAGPTVGLFIDGVPDSNYPYTPSPPDLDFGTVLELGHRNGASATEGWQGIIEDWRSYERVLSDDEIATIAALRGQDRINDWNARLLLRDLAPGATLAPADLAGTISLNSLTGTPTYVESLGLSFGRRRRFRSG